MKNYINNLTNEKTPAFLHKLGEMLSKSWFTLGSISCNVNQVGENEYEIMFYPAVREIYGGANDGERVFPGFAMNIGKFMKVFDKKPRPKVLFDSMNSNIVPHLLFDGYIDGVHAKIAVLNGPREGEEASEKFYAEGPKRGQVEPLTPKVG